MSRSLVVLPDDSARPMLDAINHASRSLRIKMFVFSDPAILQTVIAAHKRGVDVRVMLNPARRSGESENEESRKLLTTSGVNVLDSNPAFDLTHEKSMVVDDDTAFVMSFNWEPRNLTETRDYAVVTSAHHEVAEIMECFDADWTRKPFVPGDHSHLIWCVGNGRQRIGQFLDEAKHTLWPQLIGPHRGKIIAGTPSYVPLADCFHLVDGRSCSFYPLQALCPYDPGGIRISLASFLLENGSP